MTTLSIAFSTCPNDTFTFHAMIKGLIDTSPFTLTEHLGDIEELNNLAFKNTHDITKLSYHAWLHMRDSYELLDAGSALGHACGPLIVAKNPEIDLDKAKIAVPGKYTTALLLFKLKHPNAKNIIPMRFDSIMPEVASGSCDAGLIIHEGRFIYPNFGLTCLADLGQWWEDSTSYPIPLGCIAIRKKPGIIEHKPAIEELIRQSITFARTNPDASREYIKTHAQEMDDDVITRHINLYVNDYSMSLGTKGRQAIEKLEAMAEERNIL